MHLDTVGRKLYSPDDYAVARKLRFYTHLLSYEIKNIDLAYRVKYNFRNSA